MNDLNNNSFTETFLIVFGILLAKIFLEFLHSLKEKDDNARRFKKYMDEPARDFQHSSQNFKIKFLIISFPILMILITIFGQDRMSTLLIASLADVVIGESFELLKLRKYFPFLGFVFFNGLLVYMLLSKEIFEQVVAFGLGLIFCGSVILIDYLKNHLKRSKKILNS